MEKLAKNYDVAIHWRSFELRPAGSPPISPQHLKQIEATRPRLQQMARDQYGLEINAGPFGIDSRPALIADKYAESQGKGAPFHDAVMRAYWQQARAIDDVAVLQEIAEQTGLPPENFAATLADPALDAQVSADVQLAHEYGLTGAPALVFADHYLVMGAQPYEVLKQVVEKILKEEGPEAE
ncbi:MAG: DsbA family protein [Ktedonobacteraceae bacterium]|nr:DsbA family protein [Ktedonobacteraceae bacterium]